MYRAMPADALVNRVAAMRVHAASHGVTAWIVGVTFGVMLTPLAVLLIFLEAYAWGFGCVFVAALLPVVLALTVRRANRRIVERTRAFLVSGRRFEGRIASARRRSQTQSRVIVQGEGFPPFEELLATPLSDAALLGRAVHVFVLPGEPTPLLYVEENGI